MAIENSDALVIKTVDFSESSLVLTLFTRSFGKMHAIAKGARRLKNPFESALDLLTQIYVSFIRKNSASLDLLTEAKLKHRFTPTGNGLAGLYAGYYLMELINAVTVDYEPMPQLYDLAIDSLRRFEQPGSLGPDILRLEWGVLRLSGEEPSLRTCIECGEELPIEEWSRQGKRVTVALLDGGAVCPECRKSRHYSQAASVTATGLMLLDTLRRDTSAPHMADGNPFPPAVWGEIRGLVSYYIASILGHRPVMHDYMDVMIRENR